MTRPPTHLEPGPEPGEGNTATAKIKRQTVRRHPGVTCRTWTDRAGRTQRRYDATFWGPDRTEHSRSFRRLGDAEAWLEEERTNARRGGWIDPARGNETLGSFYERWKKQAFETGTAVRANADRLRRALAPVHRAEGQGPVPEHHHPRRC